MQIPIEVFLFSRLCRARVYHFWFRSLSACTDRLRLTEDANISETPLARCRSKHTTEALCAAIQTYK